MSTERLVKEFMELVQIDSESFAEGTFQKELIRRFKALGLQIWEDDTMGQTGSGANNFIARLDGDASIEPLFFSSYIDTVSPGQGIRPIEKYGRVESDGTTILGADDKAGIAIMIELIHRLKEQRIQHGSVRVHFDSWRRGGLAWSESSRHRAIAGEVRLCAG